MSDDAHGYRRPPKDTRFTKGTSGNPRGRPKTPISFEADFMSERQEKITIRDARGRAIRITKQKALVKLLWASALQNDKFAIGAIISCMRHFGSLPSNESSVSDVEDLAALKSFIQREEAKLQPASVATSDEQ